MAPVSFTWRGSLKSCNYHCSYCPFSKHPQSERELLKDRQQWMAFCDEMETWAGELKPGALLVTPYGEALIHPWYWEGFGRLSRLEPLQAVGAQTNLSFPIRESLRLFEQAGGIREKLCLWATFHPEMTEGSRFADTCRQLTALGIRLSAGAVGVPADINRIRQLRSQLPESIYLWINPMDGLKRPYTKEEIAEFQKIDPFFAPAAACPSADPSMCRSRLAIEGDGSIRSCTIGKRVKGNTEDGTPLWVRELLRRRDSSDPGACHPGSCPSRCSCYLAYGGRKDYENKFYFGPWSIFRIPWKARAVFFDVDGTLIGEGSQSRQFLISREQLEALKKQMPLFLATELPYQEAKRRCRELFPLFDGGVFGGGSHIRLEQGRQECIPLDLSWRSSIEPLQQSIGFQLRLYKKMGIVYKAVLTKLPSSSGWTEEETQAIAALLPSTLCSLHPEYRRIQILPKGAHKAAGAALLCSWLGLTLKDCAAAGNSAEDLPLLNSCGFSMAPAGSGREVLEAVHGVYGL